MSTFSSVILNELIGLELPKLVKPQADSLNVVTWTRFESCEVYFWNIFRVLLLKVFTFTEKEPTKWENIFANDTSDKGWSPNYIKFFGFKCIIIIIDHVFLMKCKLGMLKVIELVGFHCETILWWCSHSILNSVKCWCI